MTLQRKRENRATAAKLRCADQVVSRMLSVGDHVDCLAQMGNGDDAVSYESSFPARTDTWERVTTISIQAGVHLVS